MPGAKGRRLKVFQAQLGFYDSVVSAPSQAAALRAWGVHQNLFANGEARVIDDPQAVEAALAHPEMPLKRALGSTDPFALEPANLPKVPDARKKTAAKLKPKAKTVGRRTLVADRSSLDAAEATLRALDDDRKQEEAAFRRRQAELDAERERSQATYVSRRKAAATAVRKAQEAYRTAGGQG